MILTTTNTVEFGNITEYKGLIQTNLIIGNNAVSEFISGFTDFFGGFSNTLRSKFDELYENASLDIEEKARKRGANAVVGMKVDFEELAGKGKSMFMISIVGTAVKIDFSPSSNRSKKDLAEDAYVSNSMLNYEITKHKIKSKLDSIKDVESPDSDTYLSEDDWTFILSHSIPEYADKLTELFNVYGSSDTINHNYPQYIATLDAETAKNILYSNFLKSLLPDDSAFIPSYKSNTYRKIIKQLNLFDAKRIEELIQNVDVDINNVTPLLKIDKDIYKKSDLREMEDLLNLLDNLPDKGSIKEMSGGLFSKGSKMKYICPENHTNDEKNQYCSTCGLNIKGLNKSSVNDIEDFRLKVNKLRSLLEKD